MTRREVAFALALLIAGALVTAGVWWMFPPAGLIAAGVVGGLWSWLVLSE